MDVVLFFLAALLYSSVGHGGASAYLLVMSLLSFAPDTLRPTALLLNVAVSALASVTFYQNGYFSKSLFLPLILASVPCAALAARFQLNSAIFSWLLAATLGIAALRLFFPYRDQEKLREKPSNLSLSVIGAGIGTLSGLLGIGGGILLTPVLVLTRWTSVKTAAALTAPFVFLNSVAGLIGLGSERFTPASSLASLLLAVLLGACCGSWFGAKYGAARPLKIFLGMVLVIASWKMIR